MKIKILKSASDESDFLELLTDPNLLERAQKTLVQSAHENQRFESIEYLSNAVRVSDESFARRAADVVYNILLEDVLTSQQPQDLQRSLIGDRVELFRILKTYHPHQAEALMKASAGTHNYKIYQFALAVNNAVLK